MIVTTDAAPRDCQEKHTSFTKQFFRRLAEVVIVKNQSFAMAVMGRMRIRERDLNRQHRCDVLKLPTCFKNDSIHSVCYGGERNL